MTTFTNWVQNTYSNIKHLRHGQKYDLKRAQAPSVRGFREASPQRQKSPSDFTLHTLGNRTVHQYSEDRAAGTTPTVPRTSNRAMAAPRVVSNPARTDGNRSWLHDVWKPGQVKAGIDFFERLGSASAQGSCVPPSRSIFSAAVKQTAAQPPAPPMKPATHSFGKSKRAPMPPGWVAVPGKTTSPQAERPAPPPPPAQELKAVAKAAATATAPVPAPPPPPPAAAPIALTRADSQPLPTMDRSALFQELVNHRLVRSASAPETTGTASALDNASGQPQRRAISRVPLKDAPLDDFQRELKSSKVLPQRIEPIEVRPEVQQQAEALRERREAERNAANTISPPRNAGSTLSGPRLERTYLPNGRLLPTAQQKSLVDELEAVQGVRRLKTAGVHDR